MGFYSAFQFEDFQERLRKQRRFVQEPDTRAFLDALVETSKKYEFLLPGGTVVWRAQIGNILKPYMEGNTHIDDLPHALPPERMVPLASKVGDGRGNPKGIAYLYLADTEETAVAEVRPWVRSFVSIARFKTTRELRLVDCVAGIWADTYSLSNDPEVRERMIWGEIDRAFSIPVQVSDSVMDYLPTQYVAELFLSIGYDGIRYRSALSGGHNIMLYDIKAAQLCSCELFRVYSVKYEGQVLPDKGYTVPEGESEEGAGSDRMG